MPVLPSPIQEIHHPLLDQRQIQVFVKRDDLIHSEIMGNKWRKLKYNVKQMKTERKETLLTMGGAFSNHIYATAAAGNEYGFNTIGIIRGEELNENSNSTLAFASSRGMQLIFISREHYRQFRDDPGMLTKEYPNAYFLPEGGTNRYAIAGCSEIVSEINFDFDLVVTPVGTGGTFCGILKGLSPSKSILGISSLKGVFIKNEIGRMLEKFSISNSNYEINTDYHFGGYGKTKPALIDFINSFKEKFNIQLDPIYTGKSFFGVWDMIESYKFEKNLRIVLLHTGGLQGISGFNRKNEKIIA